MQKTWDVLCAEIADGMAAEWASDERRKAFYVGDGVERAKREIIKLDALRARFTKFVSA